VVTTVLTVYVVLDPWTTVRFVGLALIAKSLAVVTAVTVRLAAVECVVGGELYWPVIVKANVPVAAALVVATVSVELCPATTDAGLKLALAPAGRPAADRLTVREVPDRTDVLTV
jgi:hypothetical protein